ncbi:MAG: hypothetical protein K9M75_11785 [Phycisphaerae bacterium]|nr:hypothetical protein [Phycisphaerae bacterium]
MVDFETPKGQTIFDKINKPYEELRKLRSPIKPFLSYYREKYGEDCDLWWLDGGEEYRSHLIIKFWSSLGSDEKKHLRHQMLALFPEIIRMGGAGDNKYNRAAAWLIKVHNIICPSFRDIFTGGGLTELSINGRLYHNIPTFFARHLYGEVMNILECLRALSSDEIKFYWGKSFSPKKRCDKWLELFAESGSQWLNSKNSNLRIDIFLDSELKS